MSHLTLPLPGCQVEGAESMGEWEPVKGDRALWQDPPTPEKCLKCLRNVWQDPPTPEREKKSLREVWMDLARFPNCHECSKWVGEPD